MDDEDYGRRRAAAMSNHQPTRPVDKDKNEAELGVSIKKAVTPEETAPSECDTYMHIRCSGGTDRDGWLLPCRAETRPK
jgi:hypothetical protein